jgi:hypothetical protein
MVCTCTAKGIRTFPLARAASIARARPALCWCVCMYVCLHACVYVWMHVYVYVCVRIIYTRTNVANITVKYTRHFPPHSVVCLTPKRNVWQKKEVSFMFCAPHRFYCFYTRTITCCACDNSKIVDVRMLFLHVRRRAGANVACQAQGWR